MDEELLNKIKKHGADILESQGMEYGKSNHHHGKRSVYQHTMEVVKWSLILVKKLHLKVDERALIRGALLHDYYQYDWHIPAPVKRWHGFTHPGIAYKNAKNDFSVSKLEENIILRHMFPLTPLPPTTKEAWIVCIADKIAALYDYTVGRHR